MNTFSAHTTLKVGSKEYKIAHLAALEKKGFIINKLPYSIRILLENLLRREDGVNVTSKEIEALAKWNPKVASQNEIAFMPARVLMQDFTGVPAIVDLAAMRDAMKRMGGDPKKINPLQPAELVIDHSVQVDAYGSSQALQINAQKEFERNKERYVFLRWGQKAFNNFMVVPPDTGIVHQVNLEYLARVVMKSPQPPFEKGGDGGIWAYPDTVVGTDSHTTMVNGLGVLGWGVGGIEAEAVMLGQPIPMLIPEVVGFKLTGSLPQGATATDLVLTVTQTLRKKGVVGKFVEFFGPGAAKLSLADRATIANMAPEYGATCGFFPVDQETINYLTLTGRPREQIALTETYLKEQKLFWTEQSPDAEYSDILKLDLGTIEASLAGPKRPQDRVRLSDIKKNFLQELPEMKPKGKTTNSQTIPASLQDGSVVIAAITSCTNTSNPSVMLAAGLLAKKAVAKGLEVKPWVKTSLAPGSQVVTDYLKEAGVLPALEQLKFYVVGYGCTTCIGNSGPLNAEISKDIKDHGLVVTAVLSGNRNFEGRVHPEVRANYLASPPLVVAYALAGRVDIDLTTEPLGINKKDGQPVYLKDIWPSLTEVNELSRKTVKTEMFQKRYSEATQGDENWKKIVVPEADTYQWPESTYVKSPPYFENMPLTPGAVHDIKKARVLAVLGDSVTTDHISPAGSIKPTGPAGLYLQEHGIKPEDFNSYGARRGNHEVMMRGTFANVRLKNKLVDVEGGMTKHLPDGKEMSIFDAAMLYQKEKTPLMILAGKEYGSGSSRDWGAKGPMLLGVRAVIAESYERIHRSNLVGMGVLPLEFKPGDSVEKLGLTGHETFEISGLASGIKTQFKNGRDVTIYARKPDGSEIHFIAKVRIDTPQEIEYYRHGGILQYVLRKLLSAKN